MRRMSFSEKMKAALAAAGILAGGTVSSCATDIRDSLVSGALGAVKGASGDFVDGLIIDVNEIFEATPDEPIDTP